MTVIRMMLMGALLLALSPARGEVVNVAAGGFQVHEVVHVRVSPEKAYEMLVAPARWWSSEHTYSKDAANLSMDARAGG